MSTRYCQSDSLKRRLFGLPIAVLLTAGACGGDGGGSPTPAPSVPPTPTPAPNRAPTTVGTVPDLALTLGRDSATLNVAPSFSDPDGDSLSYRAASSDDAVVQVSVSGSVLTLTPGAAGTATVTVTASDPGGLSATQMFQVGVQPAETPNRTPTTVGSIPDQLLTAGDDPTTVNLASYFSDPDGDVLAYGAVSDNTGVARARVSGSVLTLTPGAAGTATVTVTASDPGGLSATQMFQVGVQPAETPNRTPTTVGSIPDQLLTAGDDPTTVNLASYFSDPDGDVLAYGAVSDNTGVARARVSGSVLTLTPGAAGTATVTVTASDPGGLSATQMFQVGVQPAETPNRTPTTVGSIPDQLLTAGDDPTTVNLASYFSDPDGDVLAYGAVSDNTGVARARVSGSVLTLTPGTAGTATVTVTASDPGGLTTTQSVNVTVQSNVKQTYRSGDRIPTWPAGFWVPDFNRDARYTYSNIVSIRLGPQGYIEEDGIRYTCLRNDFCAMVNGTVTAGPIMASEAEHSGNNHQPIATIRAIPEQSLITGRTATVTASRYFVEPDGDVLRYSADTSDASVARASVSAETVTITAVGGGMSTVTVTATDPGGLAAMQSVEVTVEANRPPEAVGEIPDQMLGVGQPPPIIDVSNYFRDPGDSLMYTATSSDREVATVTLSRGMLTLTAVGEGRSTITVTARDQQGLEARQSFVATVVANPDRAALVAFYEATGGDNWDQNQNWLTDAPLGDWYGVGVTRTGRVFSLTLPDNNLKGRLPSEIGDLSRLESLDLHRNWRPGPFSIGLGGRIPEEIGKLSNLSDLNLSSNELSGPIPTELAELTNLVRLDLGWNDLTGRIPIELTELPALAKLDLAQSNLTGPIPKELGAMAALTQLDLHGNGLSGGIPSELGNLSLEDLDLGFNNLTGPIPPELGDITTLLSLFLWNNRLTGPIPEELGNLGRLINLALNDNLLTGPVPESLLQLRLFSFRAANNAGVCIPDTPEFAAWVNSLTQYDEPPLCTGP